MPRDLVALRGGGAVSHERGNHLIDVVGLSYIILGLGVSYLIFVVSLSHLFCVVVVSYSFSG